MVEKETNDPPTHPSPSYHPPPSDGPLCGFQICLLLPVLLVYFSENINEVASTHWRTFSRQQYFDNKGLFISLVFSVPILLNCMIMVSGWLYQSSQLMTQLRQAQLRQNQRRQTPPYDSSSQGSCPQRLKSD
ncbi:Transmembrane protein 18 [Homalodisca vitripennis]|nr:Transmembrane protein 18 [Homalodisca vitripennis]